MAKKTKKYADGGLSFADMPEEDRAAQARSAMDAINARQAAASQAAGGMGGMKPPAPPAPRRPAPPVNAGNMRENLRDMDMAGVDTGYDATEAKRNMSRAGTRHAVGKMNLADRGYGATETKRNLNRAVSGMKKGGSVSSASKRADGIATKGKTKGRMI